MNRIGSEAVISCSGKQPTRIGEGLCQTTKEIAKGTLRSIIREVGLTVDEFKNLL
jgi:hypothetical protein